MTQPAATETEPLTIRRLSLADLPEVMAIERRAFTAPWSLAMFGLELSKPSGISLAALRGRRLVGYLVCSRYDTVWHLMNIAVEPDRLRGGIATALLGAGRPARRAVHARGASVQPRGRINVRAPRLSLRRSQARLLPRQPRRRPGHVADGGGVK